MRKVNEDFSREGYFIRISSYSAILMYWVTWPLDVIIWNLGKLGVFKWTSTGTGNDDQVSYHFLIRYRGSWAYRWDIKFNSK